MSHKHQILLFATMVTFEARTLEFYLKDFLLQSLQRDCVFMRGALIY